MSHFHLLLVFFYNYAGARRFLRRSKTVQKMTFTPNKSLSAPKSGKMFPPLRNKTPFLSDVSSLFIQNSIS